MNQNICLGFSHCVQIVVEGKQHYFIRADVDELNV